MTRRSFKPGWRDADKVSAKVIPNGLGVFRYASGKCSDRNGTGSTASCDSLWRAADQVVCSFVLWFDVAQGPARDIIQPPWLGFKKPLGNFPSGSVFFILF